jgi:hypothetical protein
MAKAGAVTDDIRVYVNLRRKYRKCCFFSLFFCGILPFFFLKFFFNYVAWWLFDNIYCCLACYLLNLFFDFSIARSPFFYAYKYVGFADDIVFLFCFLYIHNFFFY